MAFYVRVLMALVGSHARYCGKMYIRHLFPYGGLVCSERKHRRVKSKRVKARVGAMGIWEGKSALPSQTTSFFPRWPGARRTAPPTEGLEQATLTDSGLNVFLHERTVSPDKVTVQTKRDQTRNHFFSKILFIIS